MDSQRFFNIIGIIFSISLYILIFLLIAYYIHKQDNKNKDYGFNIEEAIVVNLEQSEPKKEPKPETKPILESQIQTPKKESIKPPQEEKSVKIEKKTKESLDQKPKSVKELFEDVEFKELQKEIQKTKQEIAARESRLKRQRELERIRAEKIAQEIQRRREAKQAAKIIEDLNIKTSSSSNQKSGEYDDFWSDISNKIMAAWQRTISTQDGLKANVRIRIDNRGNLTYKILKLSNNNLFDRKLKAFLDNLTYERFKSYKDGPYIEAIFEFKDQERGI